MLLMMRVAVCVVAFSCCSALCATAAQDALTSSMRDNFITNHGAPPTLVGRTSQGLHAAFRELDGDMAAYSGEVQIDNYECDDDENYSITIVWKRGDLTRDQTGILIATSADVDSGNASAASCTQLAAESAAYADGGDQTGLDAYIGTAGNASATIKASSSLAWSCGGLSWGSTGGSSTALATHTSGPGATAATSSIATAFQSSESSWQGNSATATADETGSVANAYGGDSSGTANSAERANNGGLAWAHATGAAHAYGGKGATGVEVNGGNGGSATANGGSGSTSLGGNGGNHSGDEGSGTPGAGGTASGNGTNTNGTAGSEV